MIHDCRKKKSDDACRNQHPVAKQVMTKVADQPEESPDPYDLLLSFDTEDEEVVKQIVVTDKGSRAQYACVSVSGVPANGVTDTGADITIIGSELFAWVAIPPLSFRRCLTGILMLIPWSLLFEYV